MRAKLLIVAPSAYVLGGLSTWLDYLQPGLESTGWKVTIGLVKGARHHKPENYIKVHPHRDWCSIPCYTGTREGRICAIKKIIEKTRPDIVASVNIPDVYQTVARIRQRSRASAPRVVSTIHGIQPDLYEDAKASADVLDAVICTNRLSCKLAEKLTQVDKSRIHYAPYGVSIPKGYPTVWHKNDGVMKIAYVGRLEQWQKRIHDILPILEQLEQEALPFRLDIVGDGPDSEKLKDSLQRQVDKKTVVFWGRQEPGFVEKEIYKKIDALLVLSAWETGPIVIWEAMAHGVPVVSSRYIGSTSEGSLQHGANALLFSVGDPSAAAQALRKLWDDFKYRERVVQGGIELVSNRYSQAASIAAWDDCFQKILDMPINKQEPQLNMGMSKGRLDKWLGIKFGESVRLALGRKAFGAGGGDEWPHSYGKKDYHDKEFWTLAKKLEMST